MDWTTATFGCWCGLCGRRLEPGARIALLTTHRKIRCEACATPPEDDLPLPVAAEVHPGCPSCGRIMSLREFREQGACDACRPEFQIEVEPMAAERLVTVEISFSEPELAILDELRARLRLLSDGDLIRVTLWVYARAQGIAVSPSLFAVDGLPGRQRST